MDGHCDSEGREERWMTRPLEVPPRTNQAGKLRGLVIVCMLLKPEGTEMRGRRLILRVLLVRRLTCLRE
jgi:hypothetical protein